VKSNPLVSVVLPIRNAGGNYRGVLTTLQQSLSDIEVIVIDDASTDETAADMKALAVRDSRVRLVSLPHQVGIAAALNEGIRVARANLIARMDADDEINPVRLEKQVAFLREHPEIDVLGTNFVRVLEDVGQEIHVTMPEDDDHIKRRLAIATALCHPSLLIRKDCFTRWGFYDPTFRRQQDYELWLRWRPHVRYHNLQEPLMRVFGNLKDWQRMKHTSRVGILQGQLRMRVKHFGNSQSPVQDVLGFARFLSSFAVDLVRS